MNQCDVCNGAGKIIEAIDDVVHQCPACNGRGFHEYAEKSDIAKLTEAIERLTEQQEKLMALFQPSGDTLPDWALVDDEGEWDDDQGP